MRSRSFALALAAVVSSTSACAMWSMPGTNVRPLPPLTARERALASAVRGDVEALASDIGERNFARPDALARAASYIEQRFRSLGYDVKRETFTVPETGAQQYANLVVERRGALQPREIVVVGAHYDTAPGTPGADDNASGVAVLLALAEAFAKQSPARTVRFVAFANEEPPFFQTPGMGSLHAARRWKHRGDDVVAMLSLETVGTYSDEPGSQKYPEPVAALYPSTGDFLGFVGDTSSMKLVHRAVATFRATQRLPAEGSAVPRLITGVDWSDHWSFWEQGWPALMVTTTAPFRNPRYHEPDDLPRYVDHERVARAVVGLEAVIDDLANAGERY